MRKEGGFLHGRYSVGYDIDTDTMSGAVCVFDGITKQVIYLAEFNENVIDIEHEIVDPIGAKLLMAACPVKALIWPVDDDGNIIPTKDNL